MCRPCCSACTTAPRQTYALFILTRWCRRRARNDRSALSRQGKPKVGAGACRATGSQHARGQSFVRCLHQRTPLDKIFSLEASRAEELRNDYLRYNAHVAFAAYSKTPRCSDSDARTCCGLLARAQRQPRHDLRAGISKRASRRGAYAERRS